MKISWELIAIAAEILGIVVLVVLLSVLLSKNKKKRELREHIADKSRDDRLRIALGNQYASEQVKDEAAQNVAYDVEYHDNFEKRQNAICVQLIENNPLSTQKFIFYIQDLIRIGTDVQNELVIREDSGMKYEVQLIRDEKSLFVKNCETSSRVYLQRQKKRYLLDERLVRVQEADSLLFEKVVIDIHLLRI